MNLARVFVNDTLAGGAGITLTDSAPEALPLLNAAIAQFQRDLWNRSVPTMMRNGKHPWVCRRSIQIWAWAR